MFRAGTMIRTLTFCSVMIAALAFARSNSSASVESFPSGFAVSQRVLDLPIDLAIEVGEQIHEPGAGPMRLRPSTAAEMLREDEALQKEEKPLVAATPGVSFSGIPSPGYVPSDSNLAVGPNDIVEVVNVQFAVYSKNGTTLAGPANIQQLFASLGGDCNGTDGDPIVLYDRAADRWVISYIGTNSAGTVMAECVAVSKTGNPTGNYYLYSYSFGSNLNDYPKLSTWATATNSAYLSTYNIFDVLNFTGSDLCAFDRTKMLAGDSSAAQLCKQTPSSEFGYLPGDMDGPTPPVDGTPGLFISWYNNNPGQLYLRSLKVDFASGTATLSSPTVIKVTNASLACGNSGQCIPQSGTNQTLDSLGDRLMYRFAIRHFADHDRAVVNHAVASGGSVAVRWYELYDPTGSVTLNQQGTFAPDSTDRWMASLAEDQVGDIGMGYSASSSAMHPAIRFTGRVPSDASGTMESESTIIQGAGSQVGSYADRWGDYTAMQVDPSDDCTFWYVDQYQAVTGTFDWSTNISSFVFNNCSGNPGFSLSASPGSVSLVEGSTATTTISVGLLNGFTGSVKLSASGLPTGVKAAFSTNPTTGSSTLTFTASVSASAGTSTVTIKGVSGSLTEQTLVSLNVTGNGPAVSLAPTSLAWGKFSVGTKSCCKTVTLTNAGSSTLNISSIVTTGDFGTKTVAQSCGSTVAAGASCIVKVSFTPTKTGARTGSLKISDNAPGSPQSVPLSGTGK
jgi:hypothetical protein